MNTTSMAMCRAAQSGIRMVASLLVAGATIALPPTTTAADNEVERPVSQRMELVLKSIKVLDDREPWWESAGEMTLDVRVWRVKKEVGCPTWTSRPECIDVITSTYFHFSAGTGDVVPFNRSLPVERSGGEGSAAVGPGIGFPLYPGEIYGWQFYMVDNDLGDRKDRMGLLSGELSQANGWGPPGVYDERGWVDCDDPGLFDFCSAGAQIVDSPFNPPDEKPAYFRVQYELRVVPTPDLIARSFRYDPQRDALCMGVANLGSKPSGPFEVVVTADPDGAFPGKTTTLTYGLGLDPGTSMEPCIAPQMPAGDHAISFTIDPARRVAELNEGDNTYRSRFTFVPAGGSATSGASDQTGAAGVNLTLESILVKDNGTSGESCQPGKNDIAVTVKNAGTKAAGAFRVRLAGDDIEDEAKSVTSLDGGESQEIVFEDVRLKKGDHTVSGHVDTGETVAETDESDNARTASITCT